MPEQSASVAHAPALSVPGNPSMQWRVAAGPRVQSAGPFPALPARTSDVPDAVATSSTDVAPSGMRLAGSVRAFPPPTYRHPVPRSLSLLPSASSSSPENGGCGGGLSAAPPQSGEPAPIVNTSCPTGFAARWQTGGGSVVVVVVVVVVVGSGAV